jgi:hypothetical protein
MISVVIPAFNEEAYLPRLLDTIQNGPVRTAGNRPISTCGLDYPEMSDEELTSAANDVVLAYDERETGE